MMKKKEGKKIFRSIRTRMTSVFLATTILISLTSIFILISSRDMIDKMDGMFSANVEMEEFINLESEVGKSMSLHLPKNIPISINLHKPNCKLMC